MIERVTKILNFLENLKMKIPLIKYYPVKAPVEVALTPEENKPIAHKVAEIPPKNCFRY